ncbi:hypothetical protein [Ruminococcus flavefaciens]|uniref:hypothetical protein n=1 Tax=Ruminococcus flavefaciens TaxID=1265 RepID=UPI00048B4268|nr:hypothetical protein [Ruminococcus flavefaciens]
MKSVKKVWKSISKKQKIQFVIAVSLTLLLTVQVPVMAWFRNRREAARLERINSTNTLFITAAHREDVTNLVMDDITVDGKWIVENDNETKMLYQDYVFCVAGDYVEDFTLQLTHTTNNPYTYEIFEADPTGGAPGAGEFKGRDYVVYKVTDTWPPELTEMEDNENTAEVTANGETVIYYRIRKINGKPVTLNQTVKKDNNNTDIEINTYSYTVGSTPKTVIFDGHYLNMQATGDNAGKANNDYNKYNYDTYDYFDPNVQPLYWQCTNIPGSNGTSKNAFYHEYILRVYFNNATTTYKDTDAVYITAIGNG